MEVIKMRASGHNGRTSKRGAPFKANHNDRQFDVGKAEHIDPNKTKDNIVLKMYAPTNDTRTLEEYERDFYEKVFAEGQQAKNERYKRQGHYERCKDIKALYEGARTCPEERIMQVGRGKEIDESTFEEICRDYAKRFNEKYGSNVLLIDMSLHVDESAPHCHCRRVYLAHDKDGNLIPSEAGALREMGIERPNLEQKESRYNNAKMTFTEQERLLFIEVCKDHGIDVEKEPKHGQKRKSKLEFEIEKATKKLKELKKDVFKLKNEDQNLQVAEFIRKNDKELYDVLKAEIMALEEAEELEIEMGSRKPNITI